MSFVPSFEVFDDVHREELILVAVMDLDEVLQISDEVDRERQESL